MVFVSAGLGKGGPIQPLDGDGKHYRRQSNRNCNPDKLESGPSLYHFCTLRGRGKPYSLAMVLLSYACNVTIYTSPAGMRRPSDSQRILVLALAAWTSALAR